MEKDDINIFKKDCDSILKECLKLNIIKHKDYGWGNISKFGLKGVILRLNDKIERLINLSWKNKIPNNESIEDNLKDILNYAAIGLMIKRGKWKGLERS